MKSFTITKSVKQFIIFLLLLFAPMVLLIHYPLNGNLLVDAGDGLTSFMSMSLITRALSEGEFPIWNKYLMNGMPAIGTLSLINIPAMILGWLPLEWFVFFHYCLHISFAAFFMYLYLREIKCNGASALVVALMLLFSVHFGGIRKSHVGIICAISHFPVLMFFIQRHLNTEKMKYLVLASGILAFAFAFTYTHTQHVVYMATASGIYLIFFSIKNQIKFSALIKRITFFTLLFFVFSAITLLPMIELIHEYGKYNTDNITFDYFKSGSITPFSLIYMLFPRFFGDNFYTFHKSIPASEFDYELFIGVTSLVVLLYSIKTYFRKSFQVMLSLIMCLIVFIYMSIGFVPGFRDIVYNMPVFGNFRIPSRMLFVFIFFLYSIIGIGLTKLYFEDMAIFFKFQRRFTVLIMIIICFFSVILIATMEIIGGSELGVHMGNVLNFTSNVLLPSLLVLFYIGLIFWLIYIISNKYNSFLNQQRRYYAVITIICIFTLSETIPFFKITHSSSVVKAGEEELTKKLFKEIGNGKIFDAYAGIFHSSFITQNKSIVKKLPSINAYTSFNNPILYKFITGKRALINSSGILVGSENSKINIMYQNDFFSMMGVKYIIDCSNLLPDKGTGSFNNRTLIEELNFELAPSEHDLYYEIVSIKPNTYYFVVLDYEAHQNNKEALLIMDLYDTISDSLNHVQTQLDISITHAEVLLYSGDSKDFLGEQYFRVFSFNTNEPVRVTQLNLYELETEETSKLTYIPFYNDGQNRIFENLNARDILYFPEAINCIDDIEYLFDRKYSLRLDKINYILNEQDRTFDLEGSSIKDINFKYNSITSVVKSTKGNFLNFSQNYFPGWRVYIDGKRAELKQVNALIMGVYVPPGIHTVKFAFVSMSFILGLITTCFGIFLCILLFGVFPYIREIILKNEKYN
jgi:hypothetical protein